MQPTVHLDQINWLVNRKEEGKLPGRVVCAMAQPPLWVELKVTRLTCPLAHPNTRDLSAINQGRLTEAEYFERCRVIFAKRLVEGSLAPGEIPVLDLPAYHKGTSKRAGAMLQDGDGLGCGCARYGSPKRAHPCHLEELAPALVRAGWRVVLYGRELRLVEGVIEQEGRGRFQPPSAISASRPQLGA